MENKITLPMDVSKGIQFDFTIEGITEEQAKNLLNSISAFVYAYKLEMAGGYVSVAHMEELEEDRQIQEGNKINLLADMYSWHDPDLLDMVDDDIALDDLEEWEDDLSDYPDYREEYDYDK